MASYQYQNKTHTFGADPRFMDIVLFVASCEGLDKSEVIREALSQWLKLRGVSKKDIFTQLPDSLKHKYLDARHADMLADAPEEEGR